MSSSCVLIIVFLSLNYHHFGSPFDSAVTSYRFSHPLLFKAQVSDCQHWKSQLTYQRDLLLKSNVQGRPKVTQQWFYHSVILSVYRLDSSLFHKLANNQCETDEDAAPNTGYMSISVDLVMSMSERTRSMVYIDSIVSNCPHGE